MVIYSDWSQEEILSFLPINHISKTCISCTASFTFGENTSLWESPKLTSVSAKTRFIDMTETPVCEFWNNHFLPLHSIAVPSEDSPDLSVYPDWLSAVGVSEGFGWSKDPLRLLRLFYIDQLFKQEWNYKIIRVSKLSVFPPMWLLRDLIVIRIMCVPFLLIYKIMV